MIVSHLRVKNWRNFQRVNVVLRERQFIVGANASGKSNLLDVFRFLRDIAKTEGGGLQKAVKDRGGVSKIRSLAARRDPEVAIEVRLADVSDGPPLWRYAFGLRQEARGHRKTYLTHEQVWKGDQQILNRPDKDDNKDQDRLTQTFLEQINVNADFREVVRFFQSVTYLHLVPQLLRFTDSIQGRVLENDPFGQGFLERVAKANERTRRSRLSKIEEALKIAVPQLAPLISRMQRNRQRQVLVSTQSDALLTEQGIDGREVLLLTPTPEGTEVKVAADIDEVRALLESGFTVGEVVLPRTKPSRAEQLSLLK